MTIWLGSRYIISINLSLLLVNACPVGGLDGAQACTHTLALLALALGATGLWRLPRDGDGDGDNPETELHSVYVDAVVVAPSASVPGPPSSAAAVALKETQTRRVGAVKAVKAVKARDSAAEEAVVVRVWRAWRRLLEEAPTHAVLARAAEACVRVGTLLFAIDALAPLLQLVWK